MISTESIRSSGAGMFYHVVLGFPSTLILSDRWYNTTYVMFATSTLLLPMVKLGMCPETIPLRRSVEMALEILEAMDESVVARKSVDLIKRYLKEFSLSDAQSSMANIEGSVPAYAAETPSQGTFDIPVCDFQSSIQGPRN